MMRKFVFFCLCNLLFCNLTISGIPPIHANASEGDFEETATSLGRIPENFEAVADSVKFSPNLRHVTYAAYADSGHKVVRYDNRTSPVYYAIQQGTPFFSKANRHAYIAYTNSQSDAIVAVDWKPDPTFGKVDSFIFSPDGLHYAYRTQKDQKQCVVLNGKNGEWFAGIPVKDNFLFSPDSRHLAYVAYDGKACALVLNGKVQEHQFQFIQDVAFSPDSSSIAYKGRIGKEGNRQSWCVVHNGEKHNPYSQIFSLIYSPDSKHLSYVAIKGKKMVLVVDGKEKEVHDQYGLPVYSADSETLAYSYREGKYFRVCVNNDTGPAFNQTYKFYFSPDSSRYAYVAGSKGSWRAVVDGNVGSEYKLIDVFKFSPDSSHFAYGAVTKKDEGSVIIDGEAQGTHFSVGEPYFSPDSNHIVYKEKKNQDTGWQTILNGKAIGKPYQSIGKYEFSGDSKHLAHTGQISPKKAVLVVDGKELCADENFALVDDPYFSPSGEYVACLAADAKENKYSLVVNDHALPGQYEGFFIGTPMVFDTPNRFHTLGMREPGPEFLLIEVEIPESAKLKTELPKR